MGTLHPGAYMSFAPRPERAAPPVARSNVRSLVWLGMALGFVLRELTGRPELAEWLARAVVGY